VCLSVCQNSFFSVDVSKWLFFCRCVCLSVKMAFFLSVCVSVCQNSFFLCCCFSNNCFVVLILKITFFTCCKYKIKIVVVSKLKMFFFKSIVTNCRLRFHRTRPIEEAQEILVDMLEDITSGTEDETKIFMSVCVDTLKKCSKDDLTTPVFVFERLCSLIVHEDNDVAEFFVSLEKDPQQEDFLQVCCFSRASSFQISNPKLKVSTVILINVRCRVECWGIHTVAQKAGSAL